MFYAAIYEKLPEDNRPVLVGEDLPLDVAGDGAAEDDLFQVAALEHQALGGVLVGDAHDVLFDDGAGVQFTGHVMAGGADDLDAALIGLVIEARPDEGGQEGVVDVDDVMRIAGDHAVADDLHVPGEDDERDVLALQQGHFLALHLFPVRLVGRDFPDIEGNTELFRHLPEVLVVAYDAGDVHLPLAGIVPGQQVIEAVAHLAHENGHPRLLVAEIHARVHLVSLGESGVHGLLDSLSRDGETVQFPFNPHEEPLLDGVHVLVEIDDVSAVPGDEPRHVRDDALPVRAVQQDDGFAC